MRALLMRPLYTYKMRPQEASKEVSFIENPDKVQLHSLKRHVAKLVYQKGQHPPGLSQ